MFNSSVIMSQLEKNRKVNIAFHYHSEELLKSIDALFSKLLAKIDMIYLLDSIVTVLREIIANAVKANAKRYYFKKLNLNINDDNAYAEGMKNFKMDQMYAGTLDDELKNTDYRVILTIQLENKGVRVIVENNAVILPEELKRINLRIQKSEEYDDFTETYNDIYDETEGAGLGIVLSILLLKNIGIKKNVISITSNDKTTQSAFELPYLLKPELITTKIKTQILGEIEGLPGFNQNILELLRMCKDPGAPIEKIHEKIVVDPALTTDILKLSNSAGFFPAKRVAQINEAIMVIGLVNLHDLLLIANTRRILENRYKKFQEIWNHCTKSASYARLIAKKYLNARDSEFAFLGALLHDLGKLVLLATNNDLTAWILELTKDREIRTSTVLEEISLGISHSTIGELMAEKWNFPEYLVSVIKNHHSPLNAEEQHRNLVFAVYLANMLCGFETGKYNYYYLEESVLEKFGLSSEQDVKNLHKELDEMSRV